MEALLYEPVGHDSVQCNLCCHRCRINDGKRGLCGVRENRSGTLHSLVYGKVIARQIDPIEKKPLFHLAPGSLSYSIATVGCNFSCRFCQNADIAQFPKHRKGLPMVGEDRRPEEIAKEAKRANCRTIAYTYTEPTVFFEFALETAKHAHQKGIQNVFVTNGYMTPEALDMISPWLDAANVDLKAFHPDFYKNQCGARLQPVMETLRQMKARGILVEVTTLLIPGLNDDPAELDRLARFIVDDLGVDTPWHVSRFHPTYRLTDRPPTPVSTILQAREIGLKAGLRYVYIGNVPGESGESTFCYSCGALLIERHGFHIRRNALRNSRCPNCSAVIQGIEM